MSMSAGLSLALIDGMLPSASRVSPAFDAVFLALLLTCLLVVLGLAVVGFGIWWMRKRRSGEIGPAS